jgi:hypothetical protein
MAISHAGHNHPATQAGRRACRAGNASLPSDTGVNAVYNDFVRTAPRREIKVTGPVARRMARQAVKADNLRAGRCIQAALHTRGRCACGWENWG